MTKKQAQLFLERAKFMYIFMPDWVGGWQKRRFFVKVKGCVVSFNSFILEREHWRRELDAVKYLEFPAVYFMFKVSHKESYFEYDEISNFWIPYAHHYNPLLLYFLPRFWRPFLCFQGAFSRKFCPYVLSVFKRGL